MAAIVQANMDSMVEPLRDLMCKGIFSESEIRAIVNQRRQHEYLLCRFEVRKADFIRYLESEMALERLRVIRENKLQQGRCSDEALQEKYKKYQAQQEEEWELRKKILEKRRRLEAQANDSTKKQQNEDEKDEEEEAMEGKMLLEGKRTGKGDGHIIRNVHHIFGRAKKKFKGDLALHTEHAAFALRTKSFRMLSKIYAEALQIHPRKSSLWIEAASHEYYGYKNPEDREDSDSDSDTDSGSDSDSDSDENHKNHEKGSIRSARILLLRGLRINPHAQDLWLQSFAMELHFARRVWRRKKALKMALQEQGEEGNAGEKDGVEEEEERLMLPALVVYRNAIQAVPEKVSFRLQFLDVLASVAARASSHDHDDDDDEEEEKEAFPVEEVEDAIMESIQRDFDHAADAWIARATWALSNSDTGEDEIKQEDAEGRRRGFLGSLRDRNQDDDDDDDEDDEDDDKVEKSQTDEKPQRATNSTQESNSKTPSPSGLPAALQLLDQALTKIPTLEMYLKTIQMLRDLLQSYNPDNHHDDAGGEEDLNAHELVVQTLRKIFDQASAGTSNKHQDLAHSPELLAAQADFLCEIGEIKQAIQMLIQATVYRQQKQHDTEASLWLKLVHVLSKVETEQREAGSMDDVVVPWTSLDILRRAAVAVPVKDGQHVEILVRFFEQLLEEQLRRASKRQHRREAKTGANVSVSSSESDSDEDDNSEDSEIASVLEHILLLAPSRIVANVCLHYLRHAYKHNGGRNAARRVYEKVLYKSTLAVPGSVGENVDGMDQFFHKCIQLEKGQGVGDRRSKKRKRVFVERKKAGKHERRLGKIYAAIVTYYDTRGDRAMAEHFRDLKNDDLGNQ